MLDIRAPKLVGLDSFVCQFTTRDVDGKLHKPVHEVEELTTDMTQLVTFKCYVKITKYVALGIDAAELGTRIFNYVQKALPTPAIMGAVNFGFQIVLTDDDGDVLPDAEQPALPAAPVAQLPTASADRMQEVDVIELIESDRNMVHMLRIVHELRLPYGCIGGGFIRNKVWNHLHNLEHSVLNADVDVCWFDLKADAARDRELERRLLTEHSGINWSVKNQARMHHRTDEQQAVDITEAISRWPETATAIAIYMHPDGQLQLIAPYGVRDLCRMRVCPAGRNTPVRRRVFETRLIEKKWQTKWPQVTVESSDA